MRVVIFGASGTLGSALCREFSDIEVYAPLRNEADLIRPDSVRDYLFRIRPDLVINAVAHNHGDEPETPAGYFSAMAINGRAVGDLARSARLLGVPFIHYSTDRVFGRNESGGFGEDDTPGPIERLSVYARSKLFGERMLFAKGDRFYLIRTAGLFGRSGERPHIRKSLVDTFLSREDVLISADADEVRTFTFAPDLARATRELWGDRAPTGIYHLVNDGGASAYQIARATTAASRTGAIVRPAGAYSLHGASARSRCAVLLNTKRPKLRPWQEALEEYVRSCNN